MKNLLLLLDVLLLMQGCGSVRKFNQPGTLAGQVPELVASADTLPARVNAAQTSGNQLFAEIPAASKPQTSKRVSVRHLRAAHSQQTAPRDSTELRTRREPIDIRKTNKVGLVSFSLALGSMAAIFHTILTRSDFIGLGWIGILAGIAGLITGFIGLVRISNNYRKFKGQAYPLVGVIWGGIIVTVFCTMLLVVLIAFPNAKL